jgi:hypothetical protein
VAGLVSGVALAYNGDPPTSTTGAPAIGARPVEESCIDCHDSFGLNNGGSVQLINAPTYYQPGQVYAMTVRVTSSQTAGSSGRSWGFQLTAARFSDGNGAGTFATVAGQGTMIAAGSGSFASRSYIEVSNGDRPGAASPVEWQVQWTAPAAGTGQVAFFFIGVAANGAQGTNGDWVYTGSHTTQDVTPTLPTSWGRVKTLYR